MAEVIKQFEEGPEEGKANAKVIATFDETKEDENGNLIASGRDSNMPKEGHKAKKITEFDSSEAQENGNIIVHRKPDVKAI